MSDTTINNDIVDHLVMKLGGSYILVTIDLTVLFTKQKWNVSYFFEHSKLMWKLVFALAKPAV